ncbi:MAG TPA: hypothetical protein VGH32_05390, partial [Pirellulales bacterium]
MAAVAAVALLLVTSPLHAATETWTGATNANWSVAANWTGTNTPPIANDSLIFDGNLNTLTNDDLAANTQFNGITFASTAGAFTLGGNAVTLGGNVTNNASNVETISLGLRFSAARTLAGGATAASELLISGPITDTNTAAAAQALTLNGFGVLSGVQSTGASAATPFGIIYTEGAGGNWSLVGNNTYTIGNASFNILSGGIFSFGSATDAPNVTVKAGTGTDNTIGNTTGTSVFNMVNGSLILPVRMNTVTGTINVSGGNLQIWNQFQNDNGALTNVGTINVSNGTFDIRNTTGSATTGGTLFIASRGTGVLNVSGGNVICGTLDVSRDITNGTNGTVNLNGGILTVSGVSTATANSVGTNTLSLGTFNFNGGTLKARGASATFITH